MDPQEFIGLVREAGVVGQGGAGFPAHVKYDQPVETVIANGCECEPLLYTDQYLMLTQAERVVAALRALMTATGAGRGVVAIKRKYRRVSEVLRRAMDGAGLELAELDNFYPAGDEHILVREVTGRTIPPLGLPKEVGALVANVGTLESVSQAIEGRPVTHKVVTVTGEVARPCLVRVPIGAKVAGIIEHCGGPVVDDPVYVMGGPMMGRFIDQADELERAVITKTSGGIIVLPRGHHLHQAAALPLTVMQKRAAAACIQCRFCTDLCPRFLVGHGFETHKVMRAFAGGTDSAMGALAALLCCECGVCELFSCPMGLSPRRINAALKARLAAAGVAYDGPREVHPEQAALRDMRKVPTGRLALKTGIADYLEIHPQFAGEFIPGSVRIPLRQHIGAPSEPRVGVGDSVAVGDCIGDIPAGALGARVHASLAGVVTEVGDAVAISGT